MIGAIRTRDIRFPSAGHGPLLWLEDAISVLLARKESDVPVAVERQRSALARPMPKRLPFSNSASTWNCGRRSSTSPWPSATIEKPALTLFFTTLAQQEQSHADLLRLCAAASKQDEQWLKVLRSWRDDVIRLDGEMRKAEALVSSVNDVDDALRLVVQVESSEVNQIFLAAMAPAIRFL